MSIYSNTRFRLNMLRRCEIMIQQIKGESKDMVLVFKFGCIWNFFVHNVNILAEESGLNLQVNETIWDTESYGEAGLYVTGRVNKKPGLNKKGQTVIFSDVNHI